MTCRSQARQVSSLFECLNLRLARSERVSESVSAGMMGMRIKAVLDAHTDLLVI
jgi:hypothetical protein